MSMRIAVLTQRGISINVNDRTAGIALSNRITIPYDRCSIDRTLNGIDSIYYRISSAKAIKYLEHLSSNGIKAEPLVEFRKRWFGGVFTRIEVASASIEDIDEAYLEKLKRLESNNEYYYFLKCQIGRVASMQHKMAITGHAIQTRKISEDTEMLDTFDIGITKYGYEIRAFLYCNDSKQVSINDAKMIADAAYKRGLVFTSLTNNLVKDKARIVLGFVHNGTEERKASDSIKECVLDVLKDRVDTIET